LLIGFWWVLCKYGSNIIELENRILKALKSAFGGVL